MDTANEEPLTVASLVGVAVEDELVNPALAILDLSMAIDLTSCVIGIDQINRVSPNIEHRDPDYTEGFCKGRTQRVAAEGVLSNPNVFDKKRNECIEISGVHSNGVVRSQLTDLFMRPQSFHDLS